MHYKFVPFENILFVIHVGLRSLIGDKIISNFFTCNKNIVVIIHVLSEDDWKKKPK
jgi:hypothetical protein